jgi:hypothetical protein
MLYNRLETRFGWPLLITAATKPGTIQNFPAQANEGEMMRLAAIDATENGLAICPVHDAFLLTSPLSQLRDDVTVLQGSMRRAGLAVTGGLEVRTDAKVVCYPNRYHDDRGRDMWRRVLGLVAKIGSPNHNLLHRADRRV